MKDCLDGRLHVMVAGAKNMGGEPVYGEICAYCGYFVPKMKNYKAEIERLLGDFKQGQCDRQQAVDVLSTLFREIAKESLGEQEHFQSIFDGTDGFIRRIRNEFREEILSNIEKVIK